MYWGDRALQSFVGFSNGSITWILVDGGEVVEEEADDVTEADVDEEEVNANDVDRLRGLNVLNIRNESPKTVDHGQTYNSSWTLLFFFRSVVHTFHVYMCHPSCLKPLNQVLQLLLQSRQAKQPQ